MTEEGEIFIVKRTFKIVIILLIFISFAYIASGNTNNISSINTIDPIIHAFNESDAEIFESNINTTLQIPNEFWNESEIFEIKSKLKKELGLSKKKEVRVENEYVFFDENEKVLEDVLYIHEFIDNYNRQIMATNTSDFGSISFKIHSSNIDGEKTSYIIIDIVENKGYKGIVEYNEKNQKILKEFGDNIESSINLVGSYNKKMSQEENIDIINKILEKINAVKVEEVVTDTYISTTAYSLGIPQFIQYGNNKVNFQIAMRYNNYDGRTYLYIGNPLITLSY